MTNVGPSGDGNQCQANEGKWKRTHSREFNKTPSGGCHPPLVGLSNLFAHYDHFLLQLESRGERNLTQFCALNTPVHSV
jgi:hypothetical protein